MLPAKLAGFYFSAVLIYCGEVLRVHNPLITWAESLHIASGKFRTPPAREACTFQT